MGLMAITQAAVVPMKQQGGGWVTNKYMGSLETDHNGYYYFPNLDSKYGYKVVVAPEKKAEASPRAQPAAGSRDTIAPPSTSELRKAASDGLFVASARTPLSDAVEELGRAVVSFSLGSVSGTGPRQLAFALPLILTALLAGTFVAVPDVHARLQADPPRVEIVGPVRPGLPDGWSPIVLHLSNPLPVVLRRFDVYSNNDIVRLCERHGGAESVEEFVRGRLAGAGGVSLETASGEGTNRMTARLQAAKCADRQRTVPLNQPVSGGAPALPALCKTERLKLQSGQHGEAVV